MSGVTVFTWVAARCAWVAALHAGVAAAGAWVARGAVRTVTTVFDSWLEARDLVVVRPALPSDTTTQMP